MKNRSLIATALISIAFVGDIRGQDVIGSPLSSAPHNVAWETLPIAPRDAETSEWWANTWHAGDVVPMVSRYQFEGRLCVRKKDLKDVRWYQLAQRFLETEQAVRIDGVARCTTSVLDAPNSETVEGGPNNERPTQLIRAFHSCPISGRAVGVVGLRDGVAVEKSARRALDAFYKELQSPEVQEMMDECIKWGAEIAGGAAAGFVLTAAAAEATGGAAGTGMTGGASAAAGVAAATATAAKAEGARRITKLAVQWAGRKAKEVITDESKRLGEENRKVLEGVHFKSYGDSDVRGAEMKADSWFYKKLSDSDADGVTNIAVTINALFDNGRFYLAGTPGETILAKRLIDAEGNELEAMQVFCNGITNLVTLPEKMRAVPLDPSDYRVSSIFARETINVNAMLFDIRKRNVGDVWRVDGALLNNFLHPDLEGRFEGTIFMKYVGDESQSLVFSPEAKDKVFQTRHLVMLPRHMGMLSRLSYRETGFRMDYDPDTQDAAVSVWVDKETGHVVKVEARLEGNAQTLPNLALFKGFSLYDSTGRLHFEMSAEANPARFLAEIKE